MKRGQNKLLTNAILPFAIFGDIQLYFELCFIFVLFLFAFVTNDFSFFVSGIGVVAFMFFVQMLFDETAYKGPKIYFLAPIGWLLFYLTTVVEVNALFRSMVGAYSRQRPVWQRWKRVGVLGGE